MIETIIFLPTGQMTLLPCAGDEKGTLITHQLLDEKIKEYIQNGLVSQDTILIANYSSFKLGDCYDFPPKGEINGDLHKK